jgi:hypothetical protein
MLLRTSVQSALVMAGLNLLGCTMILLMAVLTIFLYRRRIENPIDNLIGTGDLLFLPVLCFSFSPVNFIVFFIISLGVILCVRSVFFRAQRSFPLAGGLSLMLVVATVFSLIGTINIIDDQLLLNLLNL